MTSDRQLMGATEEKRLTHNEERRLYENDRVTWARYVAPSWRRMLEQTSQDGKQELWKLAGPELRAALHDLKGDKAP